MAKIIVFSGHGSWELGKDQYVQMPAKCSIKFYTCNAKTLSDGLGGQIDRGLIAGLDPDQEAGPHKSVPDMRLFPPTGLHIKRPDLTKWHVVKLPTVVPFDDKNLQVQIRDEVSDGLCLSKLFQQLGPAIQEADSVLFLWAACRAVNLKNTGGETIGVNAMQR